MFQFTPFPSLTLCVHVRIPVHYYRWVPPFGYPWIVGYLLLPAAFRSLSRPSSAPSAKASTLCSFSLDLFGLSVSLSEIVVYPVRLSAYTLYSFLFDSRFTFVLFSFQSACFFQSWWAWEDSNLRPHAYQACALTT